MVLQMEIIIMVFMLYVSEFSNNFAIQWTANPSTKPTRPYTWTYPTAFSNLIVGFSWLDINPTSIDYPAELTDIPTLTQCTWYQDRTGTIHSTGFYMIVFGF